MDMRPTTGSIFLEEGGLVSTGAPSELPAVNEMVPFQGSAGCGYRCAQPSAKHRLSPSGITNHTHSTATHTIPNRDFALSGQCRRGNNRSARLLSLSNIL